MGADIIIVVNIGSSLGTKEDLESLAGMLSQVIGVMTIQSDRRNLKLADFVITPDLGRYTLPRFRCRFDHRGFRLPGRSQAGSSVEAI